MGKLGWREGRCMGREGVWEERERVLEKRSPGYDTCIPNLPSSCCTYTTYLTSSLLLMLSLE